MKFTDRTYRTPGEELWEDLLHLKVYLDLRVVLYDINREKSEDLPVMFYYAEAPEIFMEMLRQALEKDFFFGSAKLRSLPSLALLVMGNLHHMNSTSFAVIPDRIFRDSENVVLEVTESAFKDRYTWYDKLSLVHFYGVTSCSRGCLYFLHRHMGIVRDLLYHTHHCRKIIDDKIRDNEINWHDENVSRFLTTFRSSEDVVLSAQYFAIFVTNHAVLCFWNITNSALHKTDIFKVLSKEVVASKLLEHFMSVVKNLMSWFDPGLFLCLFLEGVRKCCGVIGALESLVVKDLNRAVEAKWPLGVETFHFWNHETKSPNTIAWLLLHAFTINSKMGFRQCVEILCYILDNGEESIVNRIVSHFGLDLIDLAHLLEVQGPQGAEKVSVQSVVMQALLRHGNVHHKVFNQNDVQEGL